MRRTALAALVAVPLLLAGCTDDEPDDEPGAAPSPTSSPAPSESGSASADASPSAPTVAAATGPLIDRERIRMHAPEGWRKNRQIATFLESASAPDSNSGVSLGDLSAVGDLTLQELAEAATRSRRNVTFEEPVEIAGVEWYHATGREGPHARYEQFGTVHNGSQATINFNLDVDVPRAEQQEIIDSVLASVEWK